MSGGSDERFPWFDADFAVTRRTLLKATLATGVLSQFGPGFLGFSDNSVQAATAGGNILNGIIDMHIHPKPDVRDRRLSDIELATEARRVGARAIVIKSHVVPTMDRAWIAEQVVPGIKVFGGITLNPEVGGLNPAAVDAAIKMGAKVVWLPTSWSANERKLIGKKDGIEAVVDNQVVAPLIKILEMIAKNNLILATGHLSPEESLVVIEKAKELGVEKIVVNHPEWWSVSMPLDIQKQVASYGAYLERCYATRWPGKAYEKNFAKNVAAIHEVGYESTIISTDGGQVENPMWSEALGEYLQYMLKAGISQDALDKMTKVYPAKLLGID